jgi:hypothetical protein
MTSAPPAQPRATGRRLDPKYAPLLIPAIMAIAMSFVMSLVQTIARLGFTPNLASAWLTSFAIGVAVAIPTAILVAPRASGWSAISPARRAAHRRTSAGKQSSMPSLRAELNATQRERGTQLALASCDTPRGSSRPMPPGKQVADHGKQGGSGPRAVPLYGSAAPDGWAA